VRLINRPLAFLLAAFLLVASVLLVVEVIGYAITTKPVLVHWTTWYTWAGQTSWKAGVIRFWAVVLVVVGLVLLYIELKPARVSRVTINSDDENVDAAITRRGLVALATRAATGVDGVRRASVTTTARKIKVLTNAAARDQATATSLQEPVTEAVRNAVASLGLATSPKVSVRVTPRSG
jgi:Family of unknown function (DUF6286)